VVNIYTSYYDNESLCILYLLFLWFSVYTAIISLNVIKYLIFVMVKYGVLSKARTEFLNII
jgi:hypothetical protein